MQHKIWKQQYFPSMLDHCQTQNRRLDFSRVSMSPLTSGAMPKSGYGMLAHCHIRVASMSKKNRAQRSIVRKFALHNIRLDPTLERLLYSMPSAPVFSQWLKNTKQQPPSPSTLFHKMLFSSDSTTLSTQPKHNTLESLFSHIWKTPAYSLLQRLCLVLIARLM
jgi:hypothetical protein